MFNKRKQTMAELIPQCLKACRESYVSHTGVVGEVEYLLLNKPGHNLLAFRGTEASKFIDGHGWVDVLRDLRTLPWYDKRVGWSHSGFLKGARRVVELLYVEYGLSKDKPLVVTGHSLGGALAVNAAAVLHSLGYDVKKVITFGAPRTFKWRTAEKWRNILDVDNFSNHGDPVCDVPIWWLGWRHINEVKTSREPAGFVWDNHMLPAYFEAFEHDDRKG